MIVKPWKRVEPTVVHKIGYRTIVTKHFRLSNGQTLAFDTIHPEGQEFVMILALTPENKVVIARQFRTGPEQQMDDLPGGFVDEGESLEDCAKRELLEETGYQVGKMRYLGQAYKDAYANAKWHTFLATGCTIADNVAEHEETEEEIEVVLISIDQLLKNAKQGRMTDVTGVLMAYDSLQKMKEGVHGKSS